MDAVIWDTETTGLIENRTVHLDKQPHCIEFFGHLVNLKTGDVKDVVHSLIKPPIPLPLNVKNGKGIADMTGISEEMLLGQPAFRTVAPQIKVLLEAGPAIVAHNLTFDMDMIEIEFQRMGEAIKWPKKKICTIEQTMHLRGHRLNLSKLYAYLFAGETFIAHRATNDVLALTRVCCELYKRDIL